MGFSNLEKNDMIKIYYRCNRNSVRALEVYLETYPERSQPSISFIRKLDANLSMYGSFSKKRGKYTSRTTEEEVAVVLNQVCNFILFIQ